MPLSAVAGFLGFGGQDAGKDAGADTGALFFQQGVTSCDR